MDREEREHDRRLRRELKDRRETQSQYEWIIRNGKVERISQTREQRYRSGERILQDFIKVLRREDSGKDNIISNGRYIQEQGPDIEERNNGALRRMSRRGVSGDTENDN